MTSAAVVDDNLRRPASDLAPRRAHARPAVYDVACTDRGEARVEADGTTATLTSHTFVEDLPLATAFGDVVPPPCADLVDVALAVYVADRLCRRHPRSAPRSEPLWQREIRLQVPVRDPDRWTRGELGESLTELLGYLTDDVWTMSFLPRRPEAGRSSEAQGALFREPPPQPASAALLSGGLDSLAGLVAYLTEHPAETVVLFSGRTNKRIGSPQRTLLHELAQAFPQRVRTVAVRFGLHRRERGAYDWEEPSQRTRGFVFQAFGAVMAYMAGLNRLNVYENGVGAINLPYTDAQLGSQATRATHPMTLRLMSALLARAFDAPFTVALPYVFTTKGELCVILREAGLGHLARQSVSCDGFPQRVKRAAQCGICPPCILRRQSLHHAQLFEADPRELYRHDVYDRFAPDARERRFSLRAMDGQVYRLCQALAAERPWEALTVLYPELDEAADALAVPDGRSLVCDALLALYRRYCHEWGAFAARTAGGRDAVDDPPTPPAGGLKPDMTALRQAADMGVPDDR